MDATRRTSPLRRVAMMAALAALLLPAGSAEAARHHKVKVPVIRSVKPLKTEVGQMLTVKGRNFRRGKHRNSVAFKSDGGPAVFVRTDISTTRMLKVKVPSRLTRYMHNVGASKVATRFRLRVLASRFSRRFTRAALSPMIGPQGSAPPPAPPRPSADTGDCDKDGILNSQEADDDNDGLSDVVEISLKLDPCKPDTDGDGVSDKWEYDCDRDGVLNRDETDDDNDLLPDTLENAIGTDPCSADTDGDGAQDGFEYRSAVDLNDDSYQHPQASLPYPGTRPYPNPLDGKDATLDYDGDGLSTLVEQSLWKYTWNVSHTSARTLSPLSYSAGKQYSLSIPAAGYDKTVSFLQWASSTGYLKVNLWDRPWTGFSTGLHSYDLRDVNRDHTVDTSEQEWLDRYPDGRLSDDERDEDADGLANQDEVNGRMQPTYWKGCYSLEPAYYVSYAGTDPANADSDGDGVRDGADDQDHDDVPNLMELSRMRASHGLDDTDGHLCKPNKALKADVPNHSDSFGWVNPFNPCMPDPLSRTCPKVVQLTNPVAPFTGPDWWSLQ